MKFIQLFLIFSLPALIFGIQCAVGNICHYTHLTKLLVDVPIKTCKDACVYFKCIYHSYDMVIRIKEGVGCLEDFLNVCQYTPTDVKEYAAKNIKNYSISNGDLTFRSCSDKDECSTNGSKTWASDNVLFNIAPVYHYYNKSCLMFDAEPKKEGSGKTKCVRKIGCETGKFYSPEDNYNVWYNIYKSGDDKECDACLEFKCTNDG